MRPTGQWYYIQSNFILAIKLFSLLLERETIFFFFFSNGHEFFSAFIFAQFYMKSELPDEQNPLVLDHIPVQVPIIWPLHIKCGHSHDVVTWSELVVGEADSYFIYSEYME